MDNEFLDVLYPHADNCGQCEHGRILEKYLLNQDKDTDIAKASQAATQAWRQTKYFLFAQECIQKGLNWQEEFKKLGWEP